MITGYQQDLLVELGKTLLSSSKYSQEDREEILEGLYTYWDMKNS